MENKAQPTPQKDAHAEVLCQLQVRTKEKRKQVRNQHIYSDKKEQTGCSRSDVDETPDIPVRAPRASE